MTDFPEDLFQQIYRRAPSDSDRDRLVGVKAALGLSPRDEMWPVLMVLDHYQGAINAGREATVREIRNVLDEIKFIPEQAEPIAAAAAQIAIGKLIEQASSEIARATIKKSTTTADRISKRQLTIAAIAGSAVAAACAAGGAAAVYLTLTANGYCAERPFKLIDGGMGCVVEPPPSNGTEGPSD